jgi:hypothetical protein
MHRDEVLISGNYLAVVSAKSNKKRRGRKMHEEKAEQTL